MRCGTRITGDVPFVRGVELAAVGVEVRCPCGDTLYLNGFYGVTPWRKANCRCGRVVAAFLDAAVHVVVRPVSAPDSRDANAAGGA